MNIPTLKCDYDKVKHSPFSARLMVLDNLLLSELTGKSQDWFSVFNGSISSLGDLQVEAEQSKNVRFTYSENVRFSCLKG